MPSTPEGLYRQLRPSSVAELISDAGRGVNGFAVTQDGTKVAISYNGSTSDELFVATSTGANATRLHGTPASQQIVTPVLSPNGQWVAFSQGNGNVVGFDLFLRSTSGSAAAVQVSPARGGNVALNATRWEFSADSRYLAMTGDFTTNGKQELHVHDTVSGITTALVNATAIGAGQGVGQLGWSSQGALIARAALGAGPSQLYACLPAGPCTRIANAPASATAAIGTMGVSPNGGTVVYSSDERLPGTFDLYKLTTDGGTPARLAPDAPSGRRVLSGSITVSPDSSRVAFLANYANASSALYDLYVLPMTGSTALAPQVAITVNQDIFALTFSPGSNALAFRADFAVNAAYDVLGLFDLVTPAQTPVVLQGRDGGSVSDVLWTP